MTYIFSAMDKKSAQEISKWEYPSPYTIYSMSGGQDKIDEFVNGTYYSAFIENTNELVGYICFGESAQVPNDVGAYDQELFKDIGLGMKPEYCGQGKGTKFLTEAIHFAQEHFNHSAFRLTVARFNARAIKVYERIGFKKELEFFKATDNAVKEKFIIMTYKANSTKGKIIAAYDRLSKSYEYEDGQYNVYNIDYERPAMINVLPSDLSGLKVLDAGCAAGWYTEYFMNQGAFPIAMDISAEMVEATKRRTKGKVDVLCRDLTGKLPFEDDTFDMIISSLTLHYIKDWEGTFQEFSRVLKKGGILVYSVHHPFMDITLSQTKEYFQKELLSDHWKRGDATIEVVFYRRPLHEIMNVTSRCFQIEELLEPLPTEEFKRKKPDSYHKLMKTPNFLIIKARA